jgi:hypothetical protein
MARTPDPIPVPAGDRNDPASVSLRYSRYVLMPRSGEPYFHVYSFRQVPAYGHAVPIRITDKATLGLTWIGDLLFSLGPEWVFGAGNGVETRHPGRDKYIVLPFDELSAFGRDQEPVIRFSSTVYGLGRDDNLAFRFEMKVGGEVVATTPWQATPAAELPTVGRKGNDAVLTVFVRNDGAGGAVYSADVVIGSTQPQAAHDD